MDDFDRATELEEKFRQAAIDATLTPRTYKPGESTAVCQNEACGEPIPDARRKAIPGCRFCVECQNRRERAIERRRHAGIL
ncbi:hypothetical protein PCA31118_00025 [Pandoraea captiosa]|uniref:Zinc finger DksA/TraR C4-type domain-containing protein n=1 Tax=Pandoraea captiosa TaxID=2508302 RepID=A0A5E4ZGN2_9BURK|nr:TraR/DksA family transcriptional regulator [Pandoraea captiosa]VVE59817.1 hypothetical protein PCA31118_00025 [Pandoraea captiosa]